MVNVLSEEFLVHCLVSRYVIVKRIIKIIVDALSSIPEGVYLLLAGKQSKIALLKTLCGNC